MVKNLCRCQYCCQVHDTMDRAIVTTPDFWRRLLNAQWGTLQMRSLVQRQTGKLPRCATAMFLHCRTCFGDNCHFIAKYGHRCGERCTPIPADQRQAEQPCSAASQPKSRGRKKRGKLRAREQPEQPFQPRETSYTP